MQTHRLYENVVGLWL